MRVILSGLVSASLLLSAAVAQPLKVDYQPKAPYVVPPKAASFTTADVKLLNGPLLDSQRAATQNLLKLDLDRLVAPFMLAAGAEMKAPPYLGWEMSYLPGVGMSFYLSGISRVYAATGEPQYADRINKLLDDLSWSQDKNKGFLLGTFGGFNIMKRLEHEGWFPNLRQWGKGEATPYYALEKLMSGLRDVYRLNGNQKALAMEVKIGNWLADHMAKIKDENLQKIMVTEYGGMNWVLADLYADTGDKRFLEMSKRWHDNITVQQMVKNEVEVLVMKHANMNFPKFSGLAARYPFSGDAGDLAGARNFWESVVYHHSYATGGNSDREHFGPRGAVASRLSLYNEENCNVYNMLRLTRLLNEIEPKLEYADYMERTLFNHILSAQNRKTGEVCYFLPLLPGTERTYQPLEFFSCCTASGLDSYTRHAEYIYSQTDSALYVNLFAASEVTLRAKGLTLRQDTKFPDGDTSTFTISAAKPVTLDLVIRNPYWAAKPVSLKLNGQAVEAKPAADGYFHLNREWKNGDVVEMTYPMALRYEEAPDDKNVVAIFYGPTLLAADLPQDYADELLELRQFPALVTGGKPVDQWLTPTGSEPLTFTTAVLSPTQVRVLPLFRKTDGPFGVYWKHSTTEEVTGSRQKRAQEAASLEARTIDKVKTTDDASEKLHKYTAAGRTITGEGNYAIQKHLTWRQGEAPISYEMAVSDTEPNALYVKFGGRKQWEGLACHLTIDGVPIHKFRDEWKQDNPTVAYSDVYAIPAELTKGKKVVKVAFEKMPDQNFRMPRLVELRTIKQ